MRQITVIACLLLILPFHAFANGYEHFPGVACWSPDSRTLAVAYPDSFDGYTYSGRLVLYDRYGREQWASEGTGYSSPSFFPDWSDGAGTLAVVKDGSLVTLEFPQEDSQNTVWVQDEVLDCSVLLNYWGRSCVVYGQGQRFGEAAIWMLEPEQAVSGKLDATASGAASLGPGGWPGGRYLAYTRQPGDEGLYGYERLWIYDQETGAAAKMAPEQLRDWDYHESNPVFIDDHTLIFQRGGWGDWTLYRRDLDTNQEWIETTDGQQPSLSADGRWLGFTRREFPDKEAVEYDWEVLPSVWVRDRERNLEFRVSVNDQSAQFPAVSPDGKYIAWLGEDYEGYRVRIRRISLVAVP